MSLDSVPIGRRRHVEERSARHVARSVEASRDEIGPSAVTPVQIDFRISPLDDDRIEDRAAKADFSSLSDDV